MPKTHTRYVCQECGRVSATYMGKCPQCGAFNSMVEELVHDEPAAGGSSVVRGLTGRSEPQSISQVGGEAEDRIALPIGEFARVLGGGIVPGSIVLIGGDPGIGGGSDERVVDMQPERAQVLPLEAVAHPFVADLNALLAQPSHNARPTVAALATRMQRRDLRVERRIGHRAITGGSRSPLAIAGAPTS